MSDLLEGLDPALRLQIRTEATRLLAMLPIVPATARAFSLLDAALPLRGKGGLSRLRKGAHPLAVMLSARPHPERPRARELDLLRAWSLVGALRFCMEFNERDTHARVANGTRVIRRICEGKYRPDPLADLAELTGPVDQALRALGALSVHYALGSVPLEIQIEQLALLLRTAKLPAAPRHVFGRAHRSMAREEEIVLQEADGVTEALVVEAAAGAEEASEGARPLFYDFGRSVLPFAQARAEAQLELIEIEDRAHAWAGEFAALTTAEMRALYRDARAQASGALVAASMVSGRTLGALEALGTEPKLGESWRAGGNRICFAPDVTAAAPAAQSGFTLNLPFQIAGTEANARAWLSGRALERGSHVARLARALPDALARRGEDPALAALLTGQRSAAHVPLYYASFPLDRLQSALQAVLRDQFGALDADQFRVKGLTREVTRTGSVLSPSLSAVRAFFLRLVREVEEARKELACGPRGLVGVTAAETNLAASVLCFQTARRPWRAAFEALSQITGRQRMRVRLEGKGSRQVEDGRIVPLPLASRQALALFEGTRLRLERSMIALANQDLRARLAQVRAGEVPLFFAWEALEAAPETLSAADLALRVGAPKLATKDPRRAKHASPRRENWARHFLRAALAARGLSGGLIDAFLGHGGAASDPLAQVSAAALADFDPLCRVLDEIWAEIGVVLPEVML